MNKNKIIALKKPGEISADPLTELLRSGARKLITAAPQSICASFKNEQGRQQVVRNGYLPEQERPRDKIQFDPFAQQCPDWILHAKFNPDTAVLYWSSAIP